ncbi:SGNH/GDSL hydrolase family protein [Pelomonas cellulosilytica]|uniref:GDSL-type esterase/lipase family protein n=1 Tax=Pelomonas cellulosilytica TaxID=2906762 RepID=A0ABS8XY98_9BURK|nr:SGNH/GDSL hydrolase family protein [Pelomonas sp. P8]MCE4555751.1 GDSL-type esterase/lipase family protein [Pelomonas sp. P8]
MSLNTPFNTLTRYTLAACALLAATAAFAQQITHSASEPPGLHALPAAVQGRAVPQSDGSLLRQWPGTYVETAFQGDEVFFRVGAGDVSLRVSVDGAAAVPLVKPAPGLYRVAGLKPGVTHRLRVVVASESQAGPTTFGGFLAGAGTQPAPLPRRSRQVEFIGDSHTVGYGNTSTSRDCSDADVWATTDNTQGVAALVAAHYDADYRANAISGRGVVRNYDGFKADTLPEAYPFALFDHSRPATDDAGWQPRVIALALGTNDFSTPLKAGEIWTTREALREDYEATYVRFVEQLRQRNPGAYVVLWIAAAEDAEVRAEVARVAERLKRAGVERLGFVPVAGLSLAGCHWHPSAADDRQIADAIVRHLDVQKDVWAR